jgi:hypothetical protein
VSDHWHASLQVDTLSWIRPNQSVLLNAACLADPTNTKFIVFDLSRPGLETMIYHFHESLNYSLTHQVSVKQPLPSSRVILVASADTITFFFKWVENERTVVLIFCTVLFRFKVYDLVDQALFRLYLSFEACFEAGKDDLDLDPQSTALGANR